MRKVVGKTFLIYFSVRADALSQRSLRFAVLDVLGHPSWIRWGRIGNRIPRGASTSADLQRVRGQRIQCRSPHLERDPTVKGSGQNHAV